jgi:hypothetical protein
MASVKMMAHVPVTEVLLVPNVTWFVLPRVASHAVGMELVLTWAVESENVHVTPHGVRLVPQVIVQPNVLEL